MVKILLNGKDISEDYYCHTGEYWDVFRRILGITDKKKLDILTGIYDEGFGEGLLFDRNFSVVVNQKVGEEKIDLITDFADYEDETVFFEFVINGLGDKFKDGKLVFKIKPERIEIESNGFDDKESTIALICKRKDFLISLIDE